jgi:hypothetical protein
MSAYTCLSAHRAISAAVFLVAFLPVAVLAQQTHGSQMEVAKGVVATLPENWAPMESRFSNAVELALRAPEAAPGVPIIRTLIMTDKRQNQAEALQSLAEIAAEYDTPVAVVAIGGWPAVERKRLAPLEFPGKEETTYETAPQALRVTTAVAADDLVVRFESYLALNAKPDLADQALVLARSAVFSLLGKDPRLEQNLTQLREQLIPAVRHSSPQRSLSLEPRRAPRAAPAPTGAPRAIVQIPSFPQGEFEIAASDNGQNVVIALNNRGNPATVFSSSQDGGVTFSSTIKSPANFPMGGDPSLAVGKSGITRSSATPAGRRPQLHARQGSAFPTTEAKFLRSKA